MSSGDLITMMKSDDRSVSQQRLREIIEQTFPENPETVGRFEVEPSSRPSSDVDKEYGTDDEDSNFKLLRAADMLLECMAKEDKSEKEEPRVYSRKVNMEEMMHEVIGERLESLLQHRSITSVEPVLQNPNEDSESCQSSCVSQSKKRRSISVEERRRKKHKIVHGLEVEPIRMIPPEWLLNVMRREENGYDPKLISTRELFKTDLNKRDARLSVLFKQVKSPDFLTEKETRKIHENAMKVSEKGVKVSFVDPHMNKHVLELRKWKMSGNWNYVFVKGWKEVVPANSFKVKDVFPLWSFRSGRGKLCFSQVPPLPVHSSHGGGSTSGESGRGNSLSGGDGASTSGESDYVPVPPLSTERDSSHSGQGCSGESSSRSS